MKRKISRRFIPIFLVAILVVNLFGTYIPATASEKNDQSTRRAEKNLGFEDGLDGWETNGEVTVESGGQGGSSQSVLLKKDAIIRTTLDSIPQGSYTVKVSVRGASSGNRTSNMTIKDTGAPNSVLLLDPHISSDQSNWTQAGHRNVLVYNGQMTIEIGAGNSGGLYIDSIEVVLDSDDENPIENWGFEDGLNNWQTKGEAAINKDVADTDSGAVKLRAGDEVFQNIPVRPNTKYALTMRAKVDCQDTYTTKEHFNWIGKIGETVDRTSLGNRVNLGVRTAGGTVLRQAPAGTEDYALVTITFITGPTDTEVTVYANTIYDDNYKDSITVYVDGKPTLADNWTGNGDNNAYVDNFDLFELHDQNYIRGADVSFLPAIEDSEGKYFSNGVQQDCLRVLSNHGVNSVMSMVFVHAGNLIYETDLKLKYSDFPNEDGTGKLEYQMIDGYFDKEHASMVAKRATALGMSYMPSLHYSDAWISAAKANIPYEWLNIDYEGNLEHAKLEYMETAVYNYVYDWLAKMKEEGVNLAGVKHGNEQDGGLLFPLASGQYSKAHSRIVEASRKAAEEIVPGVGAYIHTNNGYDTTNANNFFNNHLNNGALINGAAFSLYGGRSAYNIINMARFLNNSESLRYLDYVNVETGFAFTHRVATHNSQASSMGLRDHYARSGNGQYNWLLDYMQASLDVPNPYGQTRGYYYWETDWIPAPGAPSSIGGSADCSGRTMFNNGDTSIIEMGSSQPGKVGDMMDSMYANLMRGIPKEKALMLRSPLDDTAYQVEVVEPEGITLAKSEINLTVGQIERLKPTIAPIDKVVTNSNITYVSANSNVARVSHDGFVIAVAAGTTTVTAKDSAGHNTVATVNVAAAVKAGAGDLAVTMDEKDVVDNSTVTYPVFSRVQLSADIAAGVSGKSVIFESSNPEVASFFGETWQTPKGKMRQQTGKGTMVQLNAKKAGTTKITVTTVDGEVSLEFDVVVTKTAAEKIELDKTNEQISYNRTMQLKATITPEETSFYKVAWTSADKKIATVDKNGLVKGVGVGQTTIKVVSDDNPDLYAECNIEVLPVQTEGVLLDREQMTVSRGGVRTLVAKVLPEDAVDKTLTWTTADESIATVDQDGNITGNSVGETQITATTNSGGHAATCNVIVQEGETGITGISLNTSNYYFKSDYFAETRLTETAPAHRFEAIVEPASATDDKLIWSSDSPEIATVDQMGIVTAHNAGVATITVTAKDGTLTASASVFVPVLSDSFENRAIDDEWGTVRGTGSAGIQAKVADGDNGKYLQLKAGGSGGRGQRKEFTNAIVSDKIVMDFDINLSTNTSNGSDPCYFTIMDSKGNRYLSIQSGSSQLGPEMAFSSGGVPQNNVILSNVTPVGSGFDADHWYHMQVAFDMKAKQMTLVITAIDNPELTVTHEIKFDENTDFTGDLKAIEFVGVRGRGSSLSWQPALDNFNIYGASAEVREVQLSLDKVRLIPVKDTLMTEHQLAAVVIPAAASQEVIWSSSDTSVATVDDKGLVTATKLYDSVDEIEEATCTITATSKNTETIYAEAVVEVTKTLHAVENFTITDEKGNILFAQGGDLQTIAISTGAVKQLQANITGGDGASDLARIMWESDKPAVIDIDAKTGKMEAVKPGSAIVKLTADTYNGETYEGTIEFRVIGKIILETKALIKAIDAAIEAKTYSDSFYTEESLQKYQRALSEAQGLLQQAELGELDYTAQYQVDRSVETLNAAVKGLAQKQDIAIEKLSLTGGGYPVSINKRTTLKAVVEPAHATEEVEWISSDETIATVQRGVVTALQEGTVTIMVQSKDGMVKAEKEVTVTSDLTSWYEENGVILSSQGTDKRYPEVNPFINARTMNLTGAAWSTGGNKKYGSITIDLGAQADLDNIFVAFWQTMKHKVELSGNGENWETAIDYTDSFPDMDLVNKTPTYTQSFEENTRARYIKITVLEVSTSSDWVGIPVIQVNGAFVTAEQELALLELSGPDKTAYGLNEELDLTGLDITAVYNDGSEKSIAVEECTISGYDQQTTGEQTITVGYEENGIIREASFTVHVAVRELASIRLLRPEKMIYQSDDPLDLTGMSVTAVYGDSDEKKLAESDYEVIGYAPDKLGIQTITVSYTEGEITKTATFFIVIYGLEYIEATVPDTIVYEAGKELDVTGWIVKAMYSDGDEKELTSDAYEVSGYDKDKVGEQILTVSYTEGGIIETTKVTIRVDGLTGIEINKPDKTTYKLGEDLDLTGLIVKAVYSNGDERVLENSEYEVSGYDKDTIGEQTVTVRYTSNGVTKSAVFSVTVTKVDDENQKAADAVIKKILEIGAVTLEKEKEISAARKAYEELNDEQKKLVSNYEVLSAAETELKELKAADEKTIADKKAAGKVIDQINAIGKVTTGSKSAVEAARKAYDTLSGDQKKLVTNLNILTVAEAELTKLTDHSKKTEADKAAAGKVIQQISGIGKVTSSSKASIEAARKAYNALTADQKKLVSNYQVLVNAETSYKRMTTIPKKNSKHEVGKFQYKVTKSASKNGTVTLVKPISKKLTKVIIPKTVKINDYTFMVTAISTNAFKNYKKLTTVTIGSKVKTIGNQAFYGCIKLKKVTVGEQVTHIGTRAFYNCKKLKNIVIQSKKLKKVSKQAFKGVYKNVVIKVPKNKLTKYKNMFKNKGLANTAKIKK